MKVGEEVEGIIGFRRRRRRWGWGGDVPKLLDQGRAGTTSERCCADEARGSGARQVLAKPVDHAAEVQAEGVCVEEEGSRQRAPFFVYFRTTDVTGVVKLPDGVEMVIPGTT